jgi:hypothetical protein
MYKIRELKQRAGSFNCVAVVAAMATGCLPEDFENRFKKDAPYCDMEFFLFIWEMGYGLIMGFAGINGFNPKKQRIQADIDLEDYYAYIAVKSESNSDLTHAIFWNGKQVYDPNPMVRNGRPLTDYEVLKIYPFTKEPVEDIPWEAMIRLSD